MGFSIQAPVCGAKYVASVPGGMFPGQGGNADFRIGVAGTTWLGAACALLRRFERTGAQAGVLRGNDGLAV